MTIVEKILSSHSGKAVYAGELTIVSVDGIMASDTTAPYAIKSFQSMDGKTLWDSEKCTFVIDHASPAPTEKIANLHKFMRDFAIEQNIRVFDIGEGICHQLIVEKDLVKPGQVFIGADSHTCTYGALNAFSTGVGSSDLAAVMLTGKIWLKVPETIKVTYKGTLPDGVVAKDLILALGKILGIDGATYQTIEFHGEVVEKLSLSNRMTMANMVIEMGAKAGIFTPIGLDLPYEWTATYADDNAKYSREIEIDVSNMTSKISMPNSPDNVFDIAEAVGTPIQYAFIGTCTNGRLDDLQQAAEILRGEKIASSVRLLIAPASKNVFIEAIKDGTAQILMEAGATFLPSGCGPCVGTHLGVPGDDETVISAGNRNFRGRMGNPNAKVYLSSPAVVAKSALKGEISAL
ncbi:MAG: 3-isopropylmalate dehydratase large subunit [Arcicella sp.]|jgi:3-isopropylmalate/(R)-2-methylmalate dehydratase large subunit|nr:3-isopropylmalate dehydratase large subunit [Arcicella sp.]